jgi:hypothetical protein
MSGLFDLGGCLDIVSPRSGRYNKEGFGSAVV